MSASIGILGGGRAQYHLLPCFVFLNMHAVNQPEVMIPNAAQRFDAQGNLTDETSRQLAAYSRENEDMSFLDNLENNLKTLEGREEGEDREQRHKQREAEAQRARAAAPFAERLRNGPYTAELLKQATRAGHAMRAKVNLAWLDTTLRLEARGRRLELRPTPEGVVAVFLEENRELRTLPVDLEGDPAPLVREWLGEPLR